MESRFEGQRAGEKVELIFRRHVLTAKKGFLFLFVMVILGIIPLLLWPGKSEMFGAFLVCFGVGVGGFLYAYMLWYHSYYIVTNERIRQVNQKGIFKMSVVDLGLDKIQSISYGVDGMLAGLFGYGTILIQTGVGDLIISVVPNPEKIYNKLQDVAKKA